MILIADGGSTKTDWVAIDNEVHEEFRFKTLSLNPNVITLDKIKERLVNFTGLVDIRDKVKELFFYGAGCGSFETIALLQVVFEEFFCNADIRINEDMLGAVYACTTKPGIVGILGTGSNSCYFDGEKTHSAVSLGYVVMDEASGNYFGKQLLRDYFYEKMPKHIADAFKREFNLDPDYVKKQLYRKPNANRYLAMFAGFLVDFMDESYVQEIIEFGVDDFFENRILCYKHLNLPLHFVGSIAFYFSDILKKVATKHNMTIENIIQRPINNLVDHHTKNKH